MTIKSNYKNIQGKWHENYTNQFIKLYKKIFQKLVFQEILKKFIKNNFELMISIYLFTKRVNLFSISNLIRFSRKLCTLILSKEFIIKFQFENKKDYFTTISILFYLQRN